MEKLVTRGGRASSFKRQDSGSDEISIQQASPQRMSTPAQRYAVGVGVGVGENGVSKG